MLIRKILLGAALLFFLTTLNTLKAEDEKVSPIKSITVAELRDQIFFLASDKLEGRDTGSEGFASAALYAVTQFKMSGLEPLIVDKDGAKTFFQTMSFSSYEISNKTAITISSSSGETRLQQADKMFLFRTPLVDDTIFMNENPVFLGYGIDDPAIGWSDYDDVDVRGKVVFAVGGAPSKDGKPFFPPESDSYYRNFGLSANARAVWAIEHGISALIFVPDPEMARNWSNISFWRNQRQFALLMPETKKVDSPTFFFMHPDALIETLRNAGYEWTYGAYDYEPAVLEKIKVSCSLVKNNEEEISCNNVVALLPGTDPQLKEEYIVLHAHLDHLGINSRGQVMNGADDNASGCAVVLEVAEALAIRPAKRSFIFVLFTGEEKGTLGSEWFVNNLPVPQEQIVLSAAVDMMGRQSRQKPDVIYIVAEGEGKESLFDITKRANASLIKADIDFSLNENDLDGHIMRCDLRPFLSKNITSLLFTRGFMPPVYHHPRDDPETLNYDKVGKAARLLYLVLTEVGNK